MHFGRVPTVSGIDFSLPDDAPRTAKLLRLFAGKPVGKVRVGAPIWACPKWVGSLYPSSAKSGDFLHHYGQQFDCIELNATFYRVPTEQKVRQWAEAVPEAFRFYPKVHRSISEDLANSTAADIADFQRVVGAFEDRLGSCFIQFHERMGPEALPVIARFLRAWSNEIPLAVEVRHPGWFSEHRICDELVNLLYRAGATSVITDTAGRRDALHTSLCGPRALIRFAGNLHPETDGARIAAWTTRIRSWCEAGLSECVIFIHQPSDEAIPATALDFQRALELPTARLGAEYLPGLS